MTLLLNLLPWLIGLLGFGLAWQRKQVWIAAATVAFLAVYFMVQPSYLPKGEITRTPLPAFTASDANIEDRVSKPMPPDERDQRRRESVQQGLDFSH